jgi:uncharacterized protein DUF6200
MATTTTTSVDTTKKDAGAPPAGELTIVDLGKHSLKAIRKLRKGKGKLLTRTEKIIEELKESGVLSKDKNTVVLVIRQKPVGFSLLD